MEQKQYPSDKLVDWLVIAAFISMLVIAGVGMLATLRTENAEIDYELAKCEKENPAKRCDYRIETFPVEGE